MSQKFERGSIVTNKNGDEFDCKVVILVTGDRSTSDRHFSGVCIQTYNKKIHPVGDFSTTWHLSKFVKLHDSLEEWQNESPAEQPVAWISAETKPEHNVGVLVFIPGEDNHITSGMWDVSNEWVLLDEYRTPEEEVTHWMPLPALPEGYKRDDKITDEWVRELKAIAKEELSKKAEQPVREVAIAFAEWLNSNFVSIENRDGEAVYVEYSPQEYEKKQQFKIAQLWELFKKERPAEWSGEKEVNNG